MLMAVCLVGWCVRVLPAPLAPPLSWWATANSMTAMSPSNANAKASEIETTQPRQTEARGMTLRAWTILRIEPHTTATSGASSKTEEALRAGLIHSPTSAANSAGLLVRMAGQSTCVPSGGDACTS